MIRRDLPLTPALLRFSLTLFLLFGGPLGIVAPAAGADDELTIEDAADDESPLMIEEETDADTPLTIEDEPDNDETLTIDGDAGGDGTLTIEEEGAPATEGDGAGGDALVIEPEEEPAPALEAGGDDSRPPLLEEPAAETPDGSAAVASTAESRRITVEVDRLWAEYGYFTDPGSVADQQGYLHGRALARWAISSAWEAQLSLRADGYYQSGSLDSNTTRLDYGESFIRYEGQNTRVTVGAGKVIWGRIDEIPPSDRLSTVDMSRFILDDLEDRRRASPMVRLEQYLGDAKLDLVFLPWFREAQLPAVDSVWYPVRQQQGRIMGLKATPAMAELIRNGRFTTEAPDTDGGFGARYTATAAGMDYGLTVQRTRQSTPYFRYDPAANLFEAQYPRSWSLGGDFAVEAYGATWRLEGDWFSDTPVTGVDGVYDTVSSVSWGGGVEFYPGDGDTRINLQLTGSNMIDTPEVVDRTDVYSFNGSFEVPFRHDRWRAGMRFYLGLGENDVYINPQLSYLGWEPFEVYLQAHYFQGGEGTPGGYHEDDSLLTLGWRANF